MVGLIKFPDAGAHSHSFLSIGQNGVKIDNTHWHQTGEKQQMTPKEMFDCRQTVDQMDVDPGTYYDVIANPSVDNLVGGRDKLRLVCTPDQKMEQKLAFEAACAFKPRLVMYDLNMRKYIKGKYGKEIPNLAEKWRRLCWNCFNPGDQLKCCNKCRIAQYCSKDCITEDWPVHKALHKTKNEIEWQENSELFI